MFQEREALIRKASIFFDALVVTIAFFVSFFLR